MWGRVGDPPKELCSLSLLEMGSRCLTQCYPCGISIPYFELESFKPASAWRLIHNGRADNHRLSYQWQLNKPQPSYSSCPIYSQATYHTKKETHKTFTHSISYSMQSILIKTRNGFASQGSIHLSTFPSTHPLSRSKGHSSSHSNCF